MAMRIFAFVKGNRSASQCDKIVSASQSFILRFRVSLDTHEEVHHTFVTIGELPYLNRDLLNVSMRLIQTHTKLGREHLPISATAVVISVWGIPWGVIPWWRSVIGSSAINVWIRWVVTTVRIIKTAPWRWVVIDGPTSSGRRSITTTTVVIIVATARWASIAVTITTRAISTGWAASIIILGKVGSTWGRGSGSSSVTGNIRLSLESFSGHQNKK
jgi:hypothetical protein